MSRKTAGPLSIGLNLRVANLPVFDGNATVMRSLASALAYQAGEHRLFYYLDSPATPPLVNLPNVNYKVLRLPPAGRGFLRRITGGDPWYRIRLAADRSWRSLDAFVCNAHEPNSMGYGPPHVAYVFDLAFMLPDAERYYPSDLIHHLDRWTAEGVHRAATVVAISRATASDIERVYGLPSSRIAVLYPAYDDADFRPDIPSIEVDAVLQELALERPYFLHVGTDQPRKNIPTIIKAHEMLVSRRGVRHSLVLVGAEGWDSVSRAEAAAPRSEKTVEFLSVSNRQLARLMAGAEALVMAGFYEGFGLPALEAMACGTPVIAARAGGLPEVVGDAGRYFDPNDPNDLADAMEALSTDGALREKLSKRGVERSREFSWDDHAKGMLELLEGLT